MNSLIGWARLAFSLPLAGGGPPFMPSPGHPALLDGGGTVIIIGPLPRIMPIRCGGSSGGGIGSDPVAPSAPEGVEALSLPGPAGPRALVAWRQGTRAASGFRVFRAEMGDALFCAASGLSYAQVAEVETPYYLDEGVLSGRRYGYKVQGVSEDGALASAFGACTAVDLTHSDMPAPVRGLVAENLSEGGDLNQRRVRVSWQGEALAGDFSYVVSRTYEAACTACPTAAAQEMTWVQAPQWEDAGGFDPAHEAPCAGYTVRLLHPAVGDLTSASGCAWTRVGACASLPEAPSNLQGVYDALTNEEVFTWSPAPDAGAWTEYWFYAGAHVDHTGGTLMSRATIPSYRLDAGMYRQGGTFPFTVIAVDARTGCRALPLQGNVTIPPNAGCRPPLPPSGIVATVLQDKVVVSWQGPQGARFTISKAPGRCGTAWSWQGVTDATAFTDRPPANAWVSYEVHSVDPVTGCESVTGTGCAEVFMPPPPEPPGNLAADDENYRDARVTWDAVPGASAYRLFAHGNACEPAAAWTILAETDGPEYLESLPGGTVKSYAVTALFASGYETGLSNCDAVQIPTASSAMAANGVLPTPHYFVADHLGSTRVALDGNGVVQEVRSYEPYGVQLSPVDTASNNTHLFTGHEYDASTGLTYAHARSLLSSIGKWASPDPASESAIIEDPQTWNRYAYVDNNPLLFADPDGKTKIRGAGKISDLDALMILEVVKAEFQKRGYKEDLAALELFESLGAGQPTEATLWITDFFSGRFNFYDWKTGNVWWNPYAALDVSGMAGKAGDNGSWIQIPALGLMHEVDHRLFHYFHPEQFTRNLDDSSTLPKFSNAEERRNIREKETPRANRWGQPSRDMHADIDDNDPARSRWVRTSGPFSQPPLERRY